MATTTTKAPQRQAPPPLKSAEPKANQQVAVIKPPRLAFPVEFEKKYDIDIDKWRTLTDAVFPAAKTIEAVAMALAYCKERKLDIFKRPVHIVPIFSNGKMVESVWPGINELRSTAMRTNNYAGMEAPAYGPTIEHTFKGGRISYWENGEQNWKDDPGITLRFPEWCQITVWRLLHGNRVQFPGPRVYWLETYATKSRGSDNPNAMWEKRPSGQIDKCAEAAALRRAFPEEIGDDYVPEEIGAFHTHQAQDVTADGEVIAGAAEPEPKPEDFKKTSPATPPPNVPTGEGSGPEASVGKGAASEPAAQSSEPAKPATNVTDVEDQNAGKPDLDDLDGPAPADEDPADWNPKWAKPGKALIFENYLALDKPNAPFWEFASAFLDNQANPEDVTNAEGARQFLIFYQPHLEQMDRNPSEKVKEAAKMIRGWADKIIKGTPQ